jgi:hypothetical protein
VLAAAEDLAASLGEIGLDINFSKSKMFYISRAPRRVAERNRIQVVNHNAGVAVAGVLIGTNQFMVDFCNDKVNEIDATMRKIESIVKEPALMPSCQIQACFYSARVSFQGLFPNARAGRKDHEENGHYLLSHYQKGSWNKRAIGTHTLLVALIFVEWHATNITPTSDIATSHGAWIT